MMAPTIAGEPALFFSTPATTAVWAPENTREAKALVKAVTPWQRR